MAGNRKIYSIAAADMLLGAVFCFSFLPEFIRSRYVINDMFGSSLIIKMQFGVSVCMGGILIISGILVLLRKSVLNKLHSYVVLPIGITISVFIVTAGIPVLLKYKYLVPFAGRYILIGAVIGIYALLTFALLRKEKDLEESLDK